MLLALIPMCFSCGNQEDKNRNLTYDQLTSSFEINWGKSGRKSDSVRLAIAAFSGLDEYRLYCRAWKKARSGSVQEALKTADSLVMGFPSFNKGRYLRANLRLENRDTSGSLQDFENCLKRDPVFFECRMNRGTLFFTRKMADLAYQDFREALRIKPQNPEARFNLGNAFFALGRVDSACYLWQLAASVGQVSAQKQLQLFCKGASK